MDNALRTDGVCQLNRIYWMRIGVSIYRFGPHSAQATSATIALDAGAAIAKIED